MKDLHLIDLVMSIGEATFARNTLVFVNDQLAADHVSLFVLDGELVPHLLDAASRKGTATARLAGRLYERSQFYKHDPNSRLIDTGSSDGDVMVFRQRAGDIKDRFYRDRLYRRFNLGERISAIRSVKGRWYVLSLYRDVSTRSFTSAEVEVFHRLGALLITCTAKHAHLTAGLLQTGHSANRQPYLEKLLQRIEPRLTPRERQVCALALSGKSAPGIASTLRVRPSTVATLRRRAYSKLSINKVNQLFALCMERMADESHAD